MEKIAADRSPQSNDELAAQINTMEQDLVQLRSEYLHRTGYMPPRSYRNVDWRWSVFMALGFAFITCIVYLLGIKHSGRNDPTLLIPEFFYQTDFAYFGIMTFYFLFALIMVQIDRLSGFQIWVLILGFWCAHWLVYDWAWWAYEIGLGHEDLSIFWATPFGQDLMIVDPPMWVFLTEALLGGVMAVYTFSIPKRTRELLPTVVWLYSVYIHPSLFAIIGASVNVINGIGIAGAALAQGMMLGMTIPNLKRKLNRKIEANRQRKKDSDPLGKPWVLIIICCLALIHLFLVLVPVIGVLLGMTIWYFLPLLILFVRSLRIMKLSPKKRLIIEVGLVGFVIVAMILVSKLI